MTDEPTKALIKYRIERAEETYVDFVSFDRDLVEPWVLKVKEFIDDIKHLSEN